MTTTAPVTNLAPVSVMTAINFASVDVLAVAAATPFPAFTPVAALAERVVDAPDIEILSSSPR
jgi:hypothetical protein